MEKRIENPQETENFAITMGEKVSAGQIIFLIGDLGAGKTTFTKGFAKGLGIKSMIKSPSYTIIREYENGRLPFYHMDLYRLAGENDDLGLEEYFASDGISVIEWANLLEELPEDYLQIEIEKVSDEKRIFHLTAVGTQSEGYLKELEQQ